VSEMFVTHRGVVYPHECDHMDHLNVSQYVNKFDQSTWQMFAAIGVTPTYMRENQRGVAAVRQVITYRRELRSGDLVTIRTGILEMSNKQIRFYHEMTNDDTGDLAATTIITGVHMNTQTRKACTFPDEVVARAKDMIVEIAPVI
jgi:acyl-CoA thioester hydrolase